MDERREQEHRMDAGQDGNTFMMEDFLGCFPEFSDESVYTRQSVMLAGDAAMMHVGEERPKMPLRGRQRVYALFLMAAHILYLRRQNAQGVADGGLNGTGTSSSSMPGGIPFKAQIGNVTVEYTKPNTFTSDDWTYWLSQTPYGQELLALLETVCPLGIYLNGRPESVRVLS